MALVTDQIPTGPATPAEPGPPPGGADASSRAPFDASVPWALDPRVALRPEPFGALAYHFGTRRLSFLKSRTLVAVVEELDRAPSAREAWRGAGVVGTEEAAYERALATLAETGMIRRRDGA